VRCTCKLTSGPKTSSLWHVKQEESKISGDSGVLGRAQIWCKTMAVSHVFWQDLIFFEKVHILVSRRYQLHSASATTHCPSGITEAHSQKRKKNYKKRKVPLQRSTTLNNSTNTTRTALEVHLLQKWCLQEGNSAPALLSPDHRS
jgi:hypothetical protein